MNPTTLNKYLYIKKTPTWLVRSFYALGLATWSLVSWSYLYTAATASVAYQITTIPIFLFFTIYTISSFGLNFFYTQFDLDAHFSLSQLFWHKRKEPSVDVFLPICGEGIDILRRTWYHVAHLQYHNMQVYVLDDSTEFGEVHQYMAESFGFTYFSRPNKGEMKKAGNLKYAYDQTDGEFIAIFDADFAPHPDFIRELLPHMQDPKVAIVQSPQYFEVTEEIARRSALEYGAANIQECFYRFIQVIRDRFGATICCGSNALYRRSALDDIGGTVQAGHSEDQRTGFALQSKGWIVRYVPIILAVGLCPDTIYPYFHQQHRWCTGNMDLMLSKEFWMSPISWKARLSYCTGFLFYLHHLFAVLLSLQVCVWLLFFSGNITSTGFLSVPFFIFTLIYIVFFPISSFHIGTLYALCVCLYSYCHAVIAAFLHSSVSWVPTGAKQSNISSAFKQTTYGIGLYVLISTVLFLVSLSRGIFLSTNYSYYILEFWLIYNVCISVIVLWSMYVIITTEKHTPLTTRFSTITHWKPKIISIYATAAFALACIIIYIPKIPRALSTPGVSTKNLKEALAFSDSHTPSPPHTDIFTRNLTRNMHDPDVRTLQIFLNTHGYFVQKNGPGSLSNETTFFGRHTSEALTKFQEAHSLPLTGSLEQTTRDVINSELMHTTDYIF